MKGLLLYLLVGGASTALIFGTHSLSCPYDMNPLCFFLCASPMVLCAPLTFFEDFD